MKAIIVRILLFSKKNPSPTCCQSTDKKVLSLSVKWKSPFSSSRRLVNANPLEKHSVGSFAKNVKVGQKSE